MPDDEKQQRPEGGLVGQVSCEYCRQSIPESEAFQPEGEDYVMYFCGVECYGSWQNEAGKTKPEKEH